MEEDISIASIAVNTTLIFSRPGLRVFFSEVSVNYFELFQTGHDAVAAYGCYSGWSPEAYRLASSLCHAVYYDE